jgi:hypothetical protein
MDFLIYEKEKRATRSTTSEAPKGEDADSEDNQDPLCYGEDNPGSVPDGKEESLPGGDKDGEDEEEEYVTFFSGNSCVLELIVGRPL